MTNEIRPRHVTAVLMEETKDAVTITWGLGRGAPTDAVEYFGYVVDYHGVDGNSGKRFGVRFHEKVSAYVFDWVSAKQANYEADCVTIGEDVIIVHYRDADIGLEQVGEIHAFSHVNGADVQLDLPVTLVR
jgi:hypothetical protein